MKIDRGNVTGIVWLVSNREIEKDLVSFIKSCSSQRQIEIWNAQPGNDKYKLNHKEE